MAYDRSNIFARILRGEIPAKTVYEDEFVLAFHDINPQAPIHVLIIPKGEFVSLDDFGQNGTAEQVHGFFQAVPKVARLLGIDGSGYRTLSNHGVNAGQEVPHFHLHLFGGGPLGPMLSKR